MGIMISFISASAMKNVYTNDVSYSAEHFIALGIRPIAT